ncbi:hypothetical protein [Actinomadura parmotrematis]|uniref:UTRA domain-containing protein n=1 Tax=Actinomadura parmotrematis TaxID=2864039 RepID=A0ABS7FRV7_9ACTN|nr:hypothetical protein [Actinomadura parmotrematis]MBW8483133.1 hypothetical protein [Actinomadura parmotrematis]
MTPPEANALCADGPCRNTLVRVEQDIGIVQVAVPSGRPVAAARYRITRERVHHPSRSAPFIVLRWIADA